MWSAVVILSSTRVMDKEEALEESSHPQACTCTQQLLAPCIAWLNSGFSRTKAPSLPIFSAAPSQPFPTGRCQKASFATGKAVVVVDWTCGSSGQGIIWDVHRELLCGTTCDEEEEEAEAETLLVNAYARSVISKIMPAGNHQVTLRWSVKLCEGKTESDGKPVLVKMYEAGDPLGI
ncbi:hypothetical protein BU17DRAFT_63830 [Hysterangium stoloniferum]|nr:hypothetical protein BU17DRAFT_63830 [Hysterangium stoloniferum]